MYPCCTDTPVWACAILDVSVHVPAYMSAYLPVRIPSDDDTRLMRRIKRDVAERGRDVMNVLEQYQKFVKPAFDQFVAPSRRCVAGVQPSSRGAALWEPHSMCNHSGPNKHGSSTLCATTAAPISTEAWPNKVLQARQQTLALNHTRRPHVVSQAPHTWVQLPLQDWHHPPRNKRSIGLTRTPAVADMMSQLTYYAGCACRQQLRGVSCLHELFVVSLQSDVANPCRQLTPLCCCLPASPKLFHHAGKLPLPCRSRRHRCCVLLLLPNSLSSLRI